MIFITIRVEELAPINVQEKGRLRRPVVFFGFGLSTHVWIGHRILVSEVGLFNSLSLSQIFDLTFWPLHNAALRRS